MITRTNIPKSLLVFILPLWLAQRAVPTPDFVVYYAQGNVKKMNMPEKGALKKWAKLYSKDMVSLGSHSQLILICKNFHTIKLDRPDTVRMKALLSRCTENKSSFIVSYFHFIWDELFDKKPDPQAYLHNIGAVSRSSGADRMYLFIDTINYLSGDLKIKFNASADSLTLKAFDNPIHSKSLVTMNIPSDNFHIDSLASRLKAPGVYYWNVSGLQPPRKSRCYLKVWQKKAYADIVDSLLKTVVKTDPAETAYMAGFVLEKNAFLYEAAKQYRLANKLEPGNKIYRSAYSRFL